MKLLVKIVVGLIVLLVVVVGVGFVAVNAWDWKPRVTEMASETTGRTLAIDGGLDVSLSAGLALGFNASGVRLANAAGAEPADMLKLGALTGRVQLLPLILGGDVVVDSLVLHEPVVHLAVDAKGKANWQFEKMQGGGSGGGGAGGGGGKLKIGELKLVNGSVSYADAVSGQKIEASKINLAFALTDLSAPLQIDGDMVLNKEAVSLKVAVDSPQTLLDGPAAKTSVKLETKHAKLTYDGRVLSKPVAGLDGTLDAEIPSVGRLAAWLDRPLAKGQPDPGELKVHAVFAGEGAKVTLKEASLEGKSLNAKATGSFDGSGKAPKVVLAVESGVLDIDRYLPPPVPGGAGAGGAAAMPSGDPLAALSDERIDVSALRQADVDVKVALEGLKLRGLSLGKIDFTARSQSGVLTAELAPLALYGGSVGGKLVLDAKSDTLALQTDVAIDKVKVDQVAVAATGEKSVVGTASGTVKASSRGNSPRALAKNVQGKLDFALGGVENAPGALSELRLALDLPGLEKQPALEASAVYNKEKVTLAATLDPLQKVLGADRFKLDLKLTSKPVTLAYAGAVQQRPTPGLDGDFALDVPSVGALAAWLGQPLDKGQPDPGPLKIAAKMATKGEGVVLNEATITGKALKATASGSYEAGAKVARFDAKIQVQEGDLDAYLPPDEGKRSEAKPAEAADWSREPFDFAGLRAANGKAVVTLAKFKYKGLDIAKGEIVTTIENGVLETEVKSLQVSGGTIDAKAKLDASGESAKLSYSAKVKDVEARPLLKAFADSDRLSGKANIEAEGQSQGRSEYEMVSALDGKGSIAFLNGAIHGINLAASLRQAQTLGFSKSAGEEQKTDFAELSGTYTITKGIIENSDLKMLAPLVRLTGAGKVPMPPRTIDYKLEAKLVATLKGQGGKDALAGVPIPINVTGSWQDPQYGVDWNSALTGMATDPSKLKDLPASLADKVKGLGGIGGSGASTTEQTTGSGTGGGTSETSPVNKLKGLFK